MLAGIYVDEGITGTSYRHRAEFQRMIEDCKQGKVDMVLTKSVSRFARNTVDALNVIRELKEIGVGVFFERENVWTLDSKGEFLITLLTSLAQEEARSISENTAWGLRKRFADGKYSVGYKSFLGYNAGFEINEEQAVFVRLIFRMYIQGYSAYKISQFWCKQSNSYSKESVFYYAEQLRGGCSQLLWPVPECRQLSCGRCCKWHFC